MKTRHPQPHPGSPLTLAFLALALGGLVYVLDRAPASAWLLPAGWGRMAGAARWFGSAGDWLPSFAHAFAFTLLTALCLPAGPRMRWAACAAVGLVDAAFEVAQHARWSREVAAALPAWFARVPGLDHLGRYFVHGTFDWRDLAAIAFGCAAAALLHAAATSRLTGDLR